MTILLWTLSLLLSAVVLAALARRLKVPSPSLFALGGVALALLPHGPRISLQPDLALALFVAPVLVDAAFDNSLRDLRENWIPITGLVFMAVAVTTAAVALIARWLIPAMPWPAAIALGAAIAPPDAAAAIAVLREVKLPRRLVTILEDESLLNDASALLIYRLAVGAAVAHTGNAIEVASTLAFVLVGSIAIGALLAFTYGEVVGRFSDVPSSIVMQFIGAFGGWILADRLALSGVIVLVTFAVILSRRSSMRLPAAVRVPSWAVWELAVFVLNALAFILAGLQIGPIMDRLDRTPHVHYGVFAAAILLTVILARTAWVLTYNLSTRLAHRVFGSRSPLPPPPQFKNSVLVSWCGMRGIVTLAAALALPDAFPYRDLIVLTAFAVVVGTLVVQGLTLRALVVLLRIEDDSSVDREVRGGRVEIFKALLESIDNRNDDVAEAIRREYAETLRKIDGSVGRSEREHEEEISLRNAARSAARERLNALRASGVIGEPAFQELQAELDLLELGAEVRSRW
jgi:monovalent cation/hydrogen antiporter